jgi:hypothetical protein
MAAVPDPSPTPFEGKVANIGRDGTITVADAPPGPPRRIDGYTIGAITRLDGEPPHRGEVHPDGDEFLYVVSGTIELILDDGGVGAVGAETRWCCAQATPTSFPMAYGTNSKRSSPRS